MPRKRTATMPDGTLDSRRTDNPYSHVVAVRPTDECIARRTESAERDLVKLHEAIEADMVDPSPSTVEWRTRWAPKHVKDANRRLEQAKSGAWGAFSWHSTHALAVKAAQKLASQSWSFDQYGPNIAVVEVNPI